MIQKKAGLINEVIYDNTAFGCSKNHLYISLNNFDWLIKEIVQAHATTEYLRFNPFYKNWKEKRQVDFDEYRFSIECSNDIIEDTEKRHLEECIGKCIQEMGSDEIRRGMIQFPLCRYDDPDTYAVKLKACLGLLNELVPEMRKQLLDRDGFKYEELIFGEISFEIDNN